MTPWASNPLETSLSRARKLIENVKCTKATDMESLDCLRSLSMEEVFGGSWSVNKPVIFDFPFVPTTGTKTFPRDLKEVTISLFLNFLVVVWEIFFFYFQSFSFVNFDICRFLRRF